FFQVVFTTYQNLKFSTKFGVNTRLLFRFLDFPFHAVEVLQLKFGINDLLVTNGINGAFITKHILIFETTDHMYDSINFPDISQKLIAKPFSLARAFNKASDIHDLDLRGYGPVRPYQFREVHQPGIGYIYQTNIVINGTEAVIACLRLRGGANRVEEG